MAYYAPSSRGEPVDLASLRNMVAGMGPPEDPVSGAGFLGPPVQQGGGPAFMGPPQGQQGGGPAFQGGPQPIDPRSVAQAYHAAIRAMASGKSRRAPRGRMPRNRQAYGR